MLRKVFEPKRGDVTGDWARQHNEQLHVFVLLTKYFSDNHMKQNEMGGACDMYWGEYRYIYVGKPEGKRTLVRPRRMWEGNIKMYLKEIGWNGIEWIYLTQESHKWRAHGSVPSGSTKCLEFLDRLRNSWFFKNDYALCT